MRMKVIKSCLFNITITANLVIYYLGVAVRTLALRMAIDEVPTSPQSPWIF